MRLFSICVAFAESRMGQVCIERFAFLVFVIRNVTTLSFRRQYNRWQNGFQWCFFAFFAFSPHKRLTSGK